MGCGTAGGGRDWLVSRACSGMIVLYPAGGPPCLHSFPTRRSSDLADNRPLLVMRSNLWASGYDVDGTDQTSLGQFSGRVQQTYKHSVPRFFVPEHGTMFTLALVRFPPTATKEIQYLNEIGRASCRERGYFRV